MSPIEVGLQFADGGPREMKQLLQLSKLSGVRTLLLADHWQGVFPRWMWNSELTWLAEERNSPHEYLDVFTALGYLAGQNPGRVQLGTGVTEALRRHPVGLAQAAVSLSHLTKRPPILGIGAGERMNTEPYGIPFQSPVGRFEEAVQIVKRYMTNGDSIDYSGDHFRLDGAVMDLAPPLGREPELWIAAHGPRMLGITGRYADGWFPLFDPDPSLYEKGRREIEAAAASTNRNLDSFTWSLDTPLGLAPTDAEAESVLRESRIARSVAVTTFPAETWERAGAEHPFGSDWRGYVDVIPEAIEPGDLRAAVDQVPFEVLRRIAIVGSVKTVVEKVRELGHAGLNHIVFIPGSAAESKRLFRYFAANFWRVVRKLRRDE